MLKPVAALLLCSLILSVCAAQTVASNQSKEVEQKIESFEALMASPKTNSVIKSDASYIPLRKIVRPSAELPTVIATPQQAEVISLPAPSVAKLNDAPLQASVSVPKITWSVVPSDKHLRQTLERWALNSGGKVTWQSDSQIYITNQPEITGTDFCDAVNQVFKKMYVSTKNRPNGITYKCSNDVLVVEGGMK